MEYLMTWILDHAYQAHWYLFVALILAGFNVPFCVDLLVLATAVLAATIIPENLWILFFTLIIGCYLSAMCSYWLGRILGNYLCKWKWFSRLLSPEKIDKVHRFYQKYGLLSLILGRFIPFGVRNCIFMTSGMSKIPFGKFILMDALACSLWCSTLFLVFYLLGQNYAVVWHYMKTFNLLLFGAFGVTLITLIWYKKRKKVST